MYSLYNLLVVYFLIDVNTVCTPSHIESEVLVWDLRICKSPVKKILPNIELKTGMTGSILYSTSWGSATMTDHSVLLVGYESGAICGFDLRSDRLEIFTFLLFSFLLL